MRALRERDGAVILAVRVRPGARADRLEGWRAGRVLVSVRAVPEGGKANEACLRLLARVFGVRSASLSLLAGFAARDKSVRIEGISAEHARSLLPPP